MCVYYHIGRLKTYMFSICQCDNKHTFQGLKESDFKKQLASCTFVGILPLAPSLPQLLRTTGKTETESGVSLYTTEQRQRVESPCTLQNRTALFLVHECSFIVFSKQQTEWWQSNYARTVWMEISLCQFVLVFWQWQYNEDSARNYLVCLTLSVIYCQRHSQVH